MFHMLVAIVAAVLLLAIMNVQAASDDCQTQACATWVGNDCCAGLFEGMECTADSRFVSPTEVELENSCSSAGGTRQFTCCAQTEAEERANYGCTYSEATCDDAGSGRPLDR